MFLFLLSLVALAKITHQTQPQAPNPPLDNDGMVDMLNKFRRAIAIGRSDNNQPTGFPQSNKMFKLSPDGVLAQRAELLTMQYDDQSLIPPPAPHSFAWYLSTKTNPDIVSEATTAWSEAALTMPNNATYSLSYKYFGALAYYKSTLAGCAVSWEPFKPTTNRKLYVFACVFNNQPVIGKPLYPTNAALQPGKGCTTNSCPKVAGTQSTCDKTGLCSVAKDVTFKPNTAATTKPTTSASTTASGATTKPSTAGAATTTAATASTVADGVITKEMEDEIVRLHNTGRMMAAKGELTNGKSGKKLPQGANINMLSYSRELGSQAQQFAQTCPTNTSATINNYVFGLNVHIANTVSVPYDDLVVSAFRKWFNEINANGMNMQMNFTDFLATKKDPPTHFTQMVWATHKTVGCGAHRCGSNTVVVCRYEPGGNIVGQFVYKVGAPCSACNFGCDTYFSLCIAPLRS